MVQGSTLLSAGIYSQQTVFLSGLSAVPGKQSVKKEESMRNMLAALLVLAASPAIAQDKEKLSSTDFTVRTIFAFKVPDAAFCRSFCRRGLR